MYLLISFGAGAETVGFPFPVFFIETESVFYLNIFLNIGVYTLVLTVLGEILIKIRKQN